MFANQFFCLQLQFLIHSLISKQCLNFHENNFEEVVKEPLSDWLVGCKKFAEWISSTVFDGWQWYWVHSFDIQCRWYVIVYCVTQFTSLQSYVLLGRHWHVWLCLPVLVLFSDNFRLCLQRAPVSESWWWLVFVLDQSPMDMGSIFWLQLCFLFIHLFLLIW